MSDGHTPLVSSDGLTIFSFPVTMLLYFSCRAVCALSRFLISWLSCVFFSCKSEACQKHRKSFNKSAVHEYRTTMQFKNGMPDLLCGGITLSSRFPQVLSRLRPAKKRNGSIRFRLTGAAVQRVASDGGESWAHLVCSQR